MITDYYLTTTVKRAGQSQCVYLPSAWGMEPGESVRVTVMRDPEMHVPNPEYMAVLRCASTAGGLKVTIPRLFCLSFGEWVTLVVTPQR